VEANVDPARNGTLNGNSPADDGAHVSTYIDTISVNLRGASPNSKKIGAWTKLSHSTGNAADCRILRKAMLRCSSLNNELCEQVRLLFVR
jgi:hypothetical protein